MPSFMLRDIPDQLWTYISQTAAGTEQTLRETCLELLERGRRWDAVRAGAAGGRARAARLSPAARQDQARAAARARWDKLRVTRGQD